MFKCSIYITTCILLLFPPTLFCQKKELVKDDKIKITIQGKAFAFFVFEDIYFRTATLGLELSKNNHSLGVEGTIFRWRLDTDNYNESQMYSELIKRKYLYFDYKYKPNFDFNSNNFLDSHFYLNVYNKIGFYDTWWVKSEAYDFNLITDLSFLKSTKKGTFIEPGIGIGFKSFFIEHFGYDLSANFGYTFLKYDHKNVINSEFTHIHYNIQKNNLKYYMRLNLFYEF